MPGIQRAGKASSSLKEDVVRSHLGSQSEWWGSYAGADLNLLPQPHSHVSRLTVAPRIIGN